MRMWVRMFSSSVDGDKSYHQARSYINMQLLDGKELLPSLLSFLHKGEGNLKKTFT